MFLTFRICQSTFFPIQACITTSSKYILTPNFTRTISGKSRLHPPRSNPFDNHTNPRVAGVLNEALAESLQVPETRLAFQGLSEGRGVVQLLAVLTRPSEVVGMGVEDVWMSSRESVNRFWIVLKIFEVLHLTSFFQKETPPKSGGFERNFRVNIKSHVFFEIPMAVDKRESQPPLPILGVLVEIDESGLI